jgi:CubicO group peptidase (beta-lactamase class C family)
MRHRIIFYGLVLALLSSALGCTGKPNRIEQTSFGSNNEWLTSTPEEQGLDSSLILAMLQVIQKENLGIHSILIVRHDHLVTEVYYPPYQQGTKHPVYSITKSVTSAMLGKALQEGHLESVHQGVLEFFPDIAQDTTDLRRKDITIEHLLTMSAGYNTGTMPNLYGKDASFDTVRHILTYNSVLLPPGTSFFYDSGSPHLLSAILQQATGMTLRPFKLMLSRSCSSRWASRISPGAPIRGASQRERQG